MYKPVIEINNVSKMYRLFRHPKHRIIDLLGLPLSKSAYNEFWALRDINLSIEPGSKIGIIGKNGAGKSTLLKIIAGQVKATSGNVVVRGKVQALMELGTGFHPEFSGWQNILSALSYMGITGSQAIKTAESIVDFAELEEFIHNPIKTYSAGMYARLAFSVSTNIDPEVLIIDEILGAGDTYFSHKAFDRMKELTNKGCTVLFVSHDMSAVEQLCDEAIWIDRGRILMRDSVSTISRLYAADVRKREELRLKARNSLMKISTLERISKTNGNPVQLICRIVDPEMPVLVSRVSISKNGVEFASVNVGEAQDTTPESDAFVLLDDSVGHWDAPIQGKGGVWYRKLRQGNGSSGAVVFNLDVVDTSGDLEITWLIKTSQNCRVQCFNGGIYKDIGTITGGSDWETCSTSIPADTIRQLLGSTGLIASEENVKLTDSSVEKGSKVLVEEVVRNHYDIFTGHIAFEDIEIYGNELKSRYLFKSLESMTIRIRYKVLKDIYEPEFVACFHRGGIIALQTLSRLSIKNPAILTKGTIGEVSVTFPELPLGRGKYLLSLGVFPPISRDSLDTERTAYLLQDRRYEILVEQPEGGAIDMGISRGRCEWDFSK